MASKKQQRRAEKLRRHEYEWVLPTEEGEQVVKPRELRAEKEAAKPKPAAGGKGGSRSSSRATRPVKPPSWSRAAKRMGWIGPLFFVFLIVSGGKNKPPIAVALAYAVVLTGLFIPFTYWLDRFAYRAYLKRTGAPPQQPPARRRG
jgi:hypothetical protein